MGFTDSNLILLQNPGLYAYHVGSDEEITKKIQNKEGIDKFVEVKTEMNLVDGANELLRGLK